MATQKFRNCQVCGKVFMSINRAKICDSCKAKEAELEQKALDYVRDHPKSTIQETAEATGVSEKIIMRLIDEGRFEEVGVAITYQCAKCGAPIVTGKYCQKCKDALNKTLQETKKNILKQATAAPPKSPGGGAHSSGMKKE